MKPTSIRAFLASELGDGTVDAVSEIGRLLRTMLSSRGWKVGWVSPDKIHLTLKFLGNVVQDRVQTIRDAVAPACSAREPIVARVRGVGAFPERGSPRVLWIAVEDPGGAVAALAAEIDAGLSEVGFPREARRFHAHLTLGRVRRLGDGRLADLAGELGDADCGEARLDSVALFRSDLRTGTYHVLERMPFGPGKGDEDEPRLES